MASPWETSNPHTRPWRIGDWSAELRGDELAHIRFQGRPVLRSIRAVVRDANWATVALTVEQVNETATGLSLLVRAKKPTWSITGTVRVFVGDTTLRVACDLTSSASFRTNRTGLVLLHSMELAGTPLRVGHPDGTEESLCFPGAISPHQPASDLVSLSWEDQGLALQMDLAGNLFEMEDQRNWSDASFKTYSRPLRLPFPYLVEAGERIRQEVSIAVDVIGSAETHPSDTRISLNPGGTFPQILVGAATAPDPSPPAHPIGNGVVVELDLATTNWSAALERAASSGSPLDLRVVLPRASSDLALEEFAAALSGRRVLRVAAFDADSHVTDESVERRLRTALAHHAIDAPILGGARSHFTEFNRERERIAARLDGVVIAITPLVHSVDTEQLVESLAAQRIIALQTVSMAQSIPVHIGPITLRPRFNNVSTEKEPQPKRTDLAEGYGAEFTSMTDDRQSSRELSAWTIASAAALAVPGVASLAWFEEWGPRGVRSRDGVPWPVEGAVRALADLSSRRLLWGDSPDGRTWAIGGEGPDDLVVLIANLHSEARSVEIATAKASTFATIPGSSFAKRILR